MYAYLYVYVYIYIHVYMYTICSLGFSKYEVNGLNP